MAKHVAFTGAGRLSYARQALTDLDCQVLIRPTDLTPASEQVIVGEFLTTGNLRGWSVRIDPTGVVNYRFSNNGTASIVKASTAAISTAGYTDGSKFWLRVVHDVNNGAAGYDVKFYTSDDGTTWTQLGATVTTATATTIFSSASNVITMGGEGTGASYVGKVYAIRVYSVIGGTSNLVDPDPWDWSTATYGATGVSTVTPAITAVEQDAWPSRILVSGTNLETDDSVTFYRQVAGARTAVRGASDVVPGDVSLVRVDAEQPFGVLMTYVMALNAGEEYTATPLTATLAGGNVALSDAITGVASEVVVTAWPEKRTERPSTRFLVGGRNVVVSGPRPGWIGSIDVETDTDAGREGLGDLLDTATGGVVLMRQPGPYGGVDAYISVVSDVERRRDETDGLDERRVWTLEAVEVEPWAADVEAAGFTLQDIADAYPSSLAILNLDFDTLLQIAQGDFS